MTRNTTTPPGSSAFALSRRQLELNRYWAFYRCQNYEGRRVDWNGYEHLDLLEAGVVEQTGFVPPGFYDAGSGVPLKFRRPSTPHYSARVIVDRITGLLFSEKRHPRIVVAGDPATEDWLQAFATDTRLWAKMIHARTFGGATGSACIGFKFVQGRPRVEVHDPRWCTPTFVDLEDRQVAALEKRYAYPVEERHPETGEWGERWYWYRRVITAEYDAVWSRVPVEIEQPDKKKKDDGPARNVEPAWDAIPHERVEHGMGICPVVWIPNHEVQDAVDGDPDCYGAFDLIEAIDCLMSQSHKGTVANSDPTVVVTTDSKLDDFASGSDNALKLEKGASAQYLEITGSGPRASIELVKVYSDQVQKLCRVVLDDMMVGPARTAREVDRNYASMLENADVLREQYGEQGVKRLLELVVYAARRLGAETVQESENGTRTRTRREVRLPDRIEVDEETGEVTRHRRVLGEGGELQLSWPDYFEPSADDIDKAVGSAIKAYSGGLITRKLAIDFIAEYFGVEDSRAIIDELDEEVERGVRSPMVGGAPGGLSLSNAPRFGEPMGASPMRPRFGGGEG